MKTSNKRKAIMKKEDKSGVLGYTSGITKKQVKEINEMKAPTSFGRDSGYVPWGSDQVGVDNDSGIDVPLHIRGGHFKWNFEKTTMSKWDKITLVLTLVNVAILISLVIKNVWMK